MGFVIPLFGFVFLGWFGAKLTAMGRGAMKTRTTDIGLGYRLRGRSAWNAGVVLVVAGIAVIAPFVWGMALLAIDVLRTNSSR